LFDVIVVFDGPDAVGRSRAAAGPFAVTQEFSVINGFQATLTAAQIRGLSRAPGLFRISGVSTVKLQDITSNNDFGATNARTDFLLDGSGVTICVVDTGINAAHEQFDTKGPGSVPLGPLEFLDAVNGLANPYDDHGHGTHVAGSAAGDGTGSSIYAADGIGAAPGASIVAAKVLSASGEGSDAQVVAGIDWCALNDIVDIVSMSLGGGTTDGSDPMSLAVNCVADPSGPGCSGANLPKIVVVAAGNSGGVPASVMSPGVAANAITIGAAADWSAPPGDPAKDDGLYVTNFSSRGPVEDSLGNFVRTKPDLIAPGLRVHSALINNPTYPFYGTAPNYYAALSGTSMATPYVSGVVALMIEADPSLAVADGNGLPFEKVRDILTRTAVDRGAPGPDNEYGHGVIDAYSAVAHASLAVGFVPTAYPGYTRLPGQSVADFGTWTHQFTVTSGLVGLPIAGTLTAAGAVNPLFGIWSPDLEVEIERETTPGNWSLVTAGSNEVTQSLCPGQGECGVAGRVEVAHFRPQSTGNYRFRIYPADDIFNNGAGGDFDFEISMGAATPGVAPNYPPQAGFSLACTNLACSFSDASTDFDGTIVSHAWDFGGAGTANLADPLNPSFTYNATGYYKVTLTVTDDAGAEDSFFQFLTARAVGTVNQAPVAGFSATNADLTANLTDTSTDSDGAVVTRSWNFGDGSPASSATNPSHAYAAAGTYNVTLLVTDNEGAQDSITLPVTVTDPPPNMAPFASFIVDTNPCGSWLFLNTCQFTDTSIDDDGTIVGWQWNFGPSGTMIGGTPQQPLVRFLADGPNPVHVTLMVTDNEGATNTAFMDLPLRDPATPNDTPVTTVTAPANGSAFDLGVQVTFTGTATDTEDGDLSAQIAWSSSLDGAIGTGAGVSTSGLRAGTHTITASATDSGGLTGTDTISVTINAPPNTAPTATVTAPANGTTVTEGTLVS
ncbi:MAG TPA: S8 family serine peptidase, partial [Thermohalobaculum sp.]|nr:S8 family serine peptidase [Thermohalobaculum sp.]